MTQLLCPSKKEHNGKGGGQKMDGWMGEHGDRKGKQRFMGSGLGQYQLSETQPKYHTLTTHNYIYTHPAVSLYCYFGA